MGLARTIAGRSLRGHPGRAIFSILGVAVGIATVVAVFTLDHVTVLSRTIGLDPGWGADLEVRPSAEVEDARASEQPPGAQRREERLAHTIARRSDRARVGAGGHGEPAPREPTAGHAQRRRH